jgi:hypothetical protein
LLTLIVGAEHEPTGREQLAEAAPELLLAPELPPELALLAEAPVAPVLLDPPLAKLVPLVLLLPLLPLWDPLLAVPDEAFDAVARVLVPAGADWLELPHAMQSRTAAVPRDTRRRADLNPFMANALSSAMKPIK